jgi:ankyrin repeat protein
MNETIKEFFDMIRGDDIYGLTAMLNDDAKLVNAVNENGVCALMVAIYYGRKEVTQLLLRSGAGMDAFIAAALGDTARLTKFVEADPGVLGRHTVDGWTPLHLAAFFGNKDAAQLLVDAGSPLHIRSTNALNNHPLHAAAAGRSREVVTLLVQAGADVNAVQAGGWTALHAAAQNGDAEMTKVLLKGGANIDVTAENGQTALDLAMGKGAQDVVDLLMVPPAVQ